MIVPFYKSDNRDFTIVNGDCFDVLPQFDFKFDMIFSDPPYFLSNGGISYQAGKVVCVDKGDWDRGGSPESIMEFNRKWLSLCKEKLKDNGTIWISGTHHNIFSIANVLTELGYKILNVITWAKTNPPPNISCRFFTYSAEFIIWARKCPKVPHKYNYELMKSINDGKQMTDVWRLPAIMVLPMSHNFSNFMVGNQLYNYLYGKTTKTYYSIHRRGVERPEKASEIDKDEQDHTRTDRGSLALGYKSQQERDVLRNDWKQIGDIPQYSTYSSKTVRTRWAQKGAYDKEEREFKYFQEEGGRKSGSTDCKDSLWSGTGRTCKMDSASFGGTLSCGAGRARQQGYDRKGFKKNKLRPHKNTYWCIPAVGSGEFVACMEDVLDVYERLYNPKFPVVCIDELPYEMHGEVREPIQAKAGCDEKKDFEYVRCGTCSVFGAIEPLTGRCRATVKNRRTKKDLAEFVRQVASDYQDADKIILVWDNLNTHKMGSLYEAFNADEAHDLATRFEIHYTPKHGSWLNIAEILLNIITKQCLKRRLDSVEKVTAELDKWITVRNSEPSKVDWQFKTSDARTKLKRLYPEINNLNQ